MVSNVSQIGSRSIFELPHGCEIYLGEAINWISSGRGVPASREDAEQDLIAKCASGEVVASGNPAGSDEPYHEVIDKTVWRAGAVCGNRILCVSTIDDSLGSEFGGVVSLTYENSKAIWKTWKSVCIPVEQLLDVWPPFGSVAINWTEQFPDFQDERSLLIEAVKCGNMFLPEAEKVAAENGFPPLVPEVQAADFAVMDMDDWAVEMVMAWIVWRNPLNVAHFHKEFHNKKFAVQSPFDDVPEPNLEGIRHWLDGKTANGQEESPTYEKALRELFKALKSGDVDADGTNLRTMNDEKIDACEWRRLTLIHDDEVGTVAANNLSLQIYADILINASQVIRTWPGADYPSETDANSSVGSKRQSALPGETLKSVRGSAAPASIRKALHEAAKFFADRGYLMWTDAEAKKELLNLVGATRNQCLRIFAKPEAAGYFSGKRGRRGPINANRGKELDEFRRFFQSANMRK
ncbi:hypothetical protein ASG19_04595 [Rhizobium sp. Leaf306]|uniref:hypothetical protein n=1 Tax=Rhizobium sp. Leaf306 TaxID=1736330 RepID=UPI000713F22A|nr:hypothetical protein [Rhizobium sp. Leaf306]KQQ38336.1 hypothetical protein ASG19_04595 [Rhizobium sp. Leaf306]